MSSEDPEEAYANRARRRAGFTLLGLAVAAIVVVALVFTVGRHTGSGTKPTTTTALSSLPTDSSAAPAPTVGRTTATPTAKPSKTPSPTPTPTPSGQASCAKTPCVLSGDAGKVVAAISSFRTSKGRAAVTGAATPAAGACALHSGNAPYCPGSYYWVHVPALQGPAVVAKISSLGGTSWLLDPALEKVAFGCAEAGAGDYSCAVFKIG